MLRLSRVGEEEILPTKTVQERNGFEWKGEFKKREG